MPPTVTPIYAALLVGLYLVLSFRVIAVRRREKVALGEGSGTELLARIRAHGNFAEYVPFALLLILIAEIQGAASWWLHLLGLSLLAGRILHAAGIGRSSQDFRARVAGMVLTFSALAGAALSCLWRALV